MALSRRGLMGACAAALTAALAPGVSAAAATITRTMGSHLVGSAGWDQDGTSPVNTPVNMLGCGSIRVWDTGTTWRRIEIAKGVFDWSRLDAEMAAWRAAGVTDILFTLGQPPDWATAPSTGSGSYNPHPVNDVQDAADFVTALLTRYKGQITALEHANEPENAAVFYSGTPAQLAAVSKAQADAARAVDPNIIMVGACPQSFADRTAYLGLYLRALTAAGASDAIDVVSAHAYVMPRPPEDMRKIILVIRGQMKACGYGDRPLWITEAGWGGITSAPSGSGYYDIDTGALVYLDGSVMGQPQAAAYLVRMWLNAWAAGADRLYFYAFDKAFSAIRVIDFSDKTQVLNSGVALGYFSQIFAGGRRSTNFKQQGNLYAANFRAANGHGGTIYWCGDRTTSVVSVAGALSATDVLGAAVDISSGSITANYSPVYVWRF